METDREPSRDTPPQVCQTPDVQVGGLLFDGRSPGTNLSSFSALTTQQTLFNKDIHQTRPCSATFQCSDQHSEILHNFPYSDNLILRLAKAAGEVLGKTHDELMYAFGVYMVKRIGNYGYERILKVTRL